MSKFDTHGGYFAPKDYMRVNEGGSHEENPNGGVQIGVDPEGNPNLLEEGEPVYKDYVYSDNIEAEEKFLVDNNLPKKYAGKLYSKIADDLFSEAEERPLDPISRNGLETLLGRLADAQEGQKIAKEQAELEDELANLSPEELDQLEAMLTQQETGEPMMACGGKINKMEDGGDIPPVTEEELRAMGLNYGDNYTPVRIPSILEMALGSDNKIVKGVKKAQDWAENSTIGKIASAILPSNATEAMSPAAKTKVVEKAMEEAYKAGKAAKKHTALGKAIRTAFDPTYVGRSIWKAMPNSGWRYPATIAGGLVGGIPAVANFNIGVKGVENLIDAYSTPSGVSSEGITPYTGYYSDQANDLNFDDEPTGSLKAFGGALKKYPDGGTLNPVYVTAKGPRNYDLWNLWLQSQANNGLRLSPHVINPAAFDLTGYETPEDNVLLDTAVVTDDAPRGYEFENKVPVPQEKLKVTPHPMMPWPTVLDVDESDSASNTSSDSSSTSILPTWPRYAGAIGSGLLGLYDAFQQPDKYKAQRIQPYTPEGRINFQNQVYNPIDQNMVANAQIAQTNATKRALRNSGLGLSTAASILAADNNATGNLGTGFIQAWDANNQRRNSVVAANNQSEAQRAQFDANIDYYRTMALRDAAVRNAQNDLMIQRLNNEAEAAKYNAISNQINSGLEALSGIGQENFAMNQINTNPYFIGYGTGPNGGIYYNPLTRRYEYPVTSKAEKKTEAAAPAGISPFIPLQYNVPQSRPTLFPSSESKYLTVKRNK